MTNLRQGIAMGADNYLTKPCGIELFLTMATTYLDRLFTQFSCLHLFISALNKSKIASIINLSLGVTKILSLGIETALFKDYQE